MASRLPALPELSCASLGWWLVKGQDRGWRLAVPAHCFRLSPRLTEHVQDKSKLPILIFPEGELACAGREPAQQQAQHLDP